MAAEPVFGTNAETSYARGITPPKGKSVVYIFQPQGGPGVSPTIWLNNYKIGRLVPGSFTVWQLAPGKLSVRTEGETPSTVSLISRAGNVYLFRLSVAQSGSHAQITSLPGSYRSQLASSRLLKNPRAITAQASAPPAQNAVRKPSPPTAKPSPPTETGNTDRIQTSQPAVSGGFVPGGGGLILKLGSLSISQETQTILSTDRRFDDSASSPYAIEGYFQFNSGLAVGGELIAYTAEFTSVGLNDKHDVDVMMFMGTVRQYFRYRQNLQPFVGAGIGFAVTDVSGPSVSGNTSGVAYQLLAGLEYRFSSVGVFAEYKFIGADTESDNNENIDVSGNGIFAGVAFHF